MITQTSSISFLSMLHLLLLFSLSQESFLYLLYQNFWLKVTKDMQIKREIEEEEASRVHSILYAFKAFDYCIPKNVPVWDYY